MFMGHHLARLVLGHVWEESSGRWGWFPKSSINFSACQCMKESKRPQNTNLDRLVSQSKSSPNYTFVYMNFYLNFKECITIVDSDDTSPCLKCMGECVRLDLEPEKKGWIFMY